MAKPLSLIDKLRDSIEAQRAAVKQQLREYLGSMDPFEFEKLVAQLLERMNFADCEVTQRHKDGGIDLRASFSIGIGKIRTIGQVKRRKAQVNTDVLRAFYGVMMSQSGHDQAHLGLFITTSRFTSEAKRWVEESHLPIVLIDGEKLAGLLVEHQLLVEAVPLPAALALAVGREPARVQLAELAEDEVSTREVRRTAARRGGPRKQLFRWDLSMDRDGSFVLTARYLPDETKSFQVRGQRVPPTGDFAGARARLQAEIRERMRPLFPDLDEVHLNARAWSGTHKVYPSDLYGQH